MSEPNTQATGTAPGQATGTIEATIERYADQGRCVARVDGRVVFVRFALPGERVRIALDQPARADDRFWTGEVAEVLEASPDRVAPPWPLAGPLAQGGGVGGADLIHVSLEGQTRWKSALIAEQMRRLGHVDVDVPVSRVEDAAAPDGLHWRTRIELIADAGGRASMRRRESHDRVPLSDMPLATRRALDIAAREGLWDGGFRPGAKIRLSVPEPRDGGDFAAGDGDGNFALLVDGEVAKGEPTLRETVDVDGHRFDYQVDAGGFWQVHRLAPPTLAGHVTGQVRRALAAMGGDGGKSTIWDLYSGSGLFTLPLATLCAPQGRVLAVEGARGAVRNAKANVEAAGLDQVIEMTGDVARTLRHVPNATKRPDVVVLDPPRAGARRQVCQAIAESGARAIVYVACDPTSLARDTATLTGLGYRLDGIHAFDIYPMTHHVETVATFTRDGGAAEHAPGHASDRAPGHGAVHGASHGRGGRA